MSHLRVFIMSLCLPATLVTTAAAQDTIKIGELNSYKAIPAFLEPYRKGWQLAVEEVNEAGGVLGRKIEVIAREDGANPGDAVRVASELVNRERVNILAGTFLSHVGLAISEFAAKNKIFFLAAEPLTDKLIWQKGNRYTFRVHASTYQQVAMLMPEALAAKKKRWGVLYPNFEFGQSAAAAFKDMIKKAQPEAEIVVEQNPPMGKVDAGAIMQAIEAAKPDAVFFVFFATDLAKQIREANIRGTFKDRLVLSILLGGPEYIDPLKEEAPEGWIVTGYPWYSIKTPEHDTFLAAYQKRWNDYPRYASLIGYVTLKSIATGIAKAGTTETEKLVDAFKGLKVESPLGPFFYRASDHQATFGSFVGKTALRDGKGIMVDYRYVDGLSVLPSDDEVKKLRPPETQ